MASTGGTTTNRLLMDTSAVCFRKIKLVREPLLVVTEHYNVVSEYFTVHVDLFMSVNKRNFFGIRGQKTFTGSAALYYERNNEVLRQSVDINEFTNFDNTLQELLKRELQSALNVSLQRHKETPVPASNTLVGTGAI